MQIQWTIDPTLPPPPPPPPQYVLDVVANEPTKLAPDSQPNTPIVSNVEAPACRVLVKDLTLNIRVTQLHCIELS